MALQTQVAVLQGALNTGHADLTAISRKFVASGTQAIQSCVSMALSTDDVWLLAQCRETVDALRSAVFQLLVPTAKVRVQPYMTGC